MSFIFEEIVSSLIKGVRKQILKRLFSEVASSYSNLTIANKFRSLLIISPSTK